MQSEVQRAIASSASQSNASSQAGSVLEAPNSDKQEEVSNEVLLEGVTTVKVRADAAVAVEVVEATDFTPTDTLLVGDNGALVDFNYTPPELLSKNN